VAPLVRMRGLTKSFPGVLALDGVDVELEPGEVHALAGENGSGKSTLVKILYGALQHGIVAISQELTLAPTLTVAENVLMNRLPVRGPFVDWQKAHRLTRPALDQLGVHVDPRTRVGDLSIELQQEVEIARAVSANSRVLILDEATSSLSEAATERLLAKVDQLRRQGVAVVYISHRLRELYQCAQRATVLRDGRLVGTVPLPETPEHELVRMMVGRAIEDLYGKRQVERGEPLLEVTGMTTHDGAVHDASLTVRAGEIVGVAGLVGSGKTELGLALAGALPADGEIRVRGRTVRLRSPRDAIAHGIGFIPEDRKRSALLPPRSVRHNLSLAWLPRLRRAGFVDVREERRLAFETVRRFAIRTRSLETRIAELSGGNQQKVVLGRWLALAPEVIVLTEPTRGIDVGAKSDVYRFVQERAAGGAAVVVISSELPEILGLADRIVVMFRGRVVAEFDGRTATEEEIAHVALGGLATEAVA
jgi:ABC-type sugar transport system ATPase subunit